MNINISIRRKKASSPASHIVCGNTDYQITFTFDSEWDAYDVKTARFIWNGQYVDVVFTGNVCPVPTIRNATLCMVGVYAGDLHTTTPAYIKCDKSILCGDGAPAEPTEDVYAQIMEKLNSGDIGGARAFCVTLTESGGKYTADKKVAEIEAAYRSDSILCCEVPVGGEVYVIPMVSRTSSTTWTFEGIVYGEIVRVQFMGDTVIDVTCSSAGLVGPAGPQGPAGSAGVGVKSVAQTTTSTADGGTNVVTVTLTDGSKSTFNVKNGSKGSQGSQGPAGSTGPKGDTGVGVKSVVQTTTSNADGGTNVVTVTLTDGSKSTFSVKNGSKGSAGGGSGGGGVSSWNDLEDKPFYSEVGLAELLPETTVEFVESETPLSAEIPVEPGKEYTVKWNGTEYSCTAQSMDLGGVVGYVLGDLGAMTGGDSTGEPFIIVAFPPEAAALAGAAGMVMALDGSASATFSVLGEGEIVHPIDPKYLGLDWLPTTENGATLLAETALAFEEGAPTTLNLSETPAGPLIIFFDGVRQYCEPTVPMEGELGYGSGNPFQLLVLPSQTAMYAAAPGVHSVAVYDPSGSGTVYNIMPKEFLPGMAFNAGEAYGSARSAGARAEGADYKLGAYATAEGHDTRASGEASHAEGSYTWAAGDFAHVEGYSGDAPGFAAHAEGYDTNAGGDGAHAEGGYAVASGVYSHAEGRWTIAASNDQHVQGRYNVKDTAGKYAHIVGNGTSAATGFRSNAHTLDWEGNAWYAGTVEATAIILTSRDGSGKRFKVSVDDKQQLYCLEVTD